MGFRVSGFRIFGFRVSGFGNWVLGLRILGFRFLGFSKGFGMYRVRVNLSHKRITLNPKPRHSCNGDAKLYANRKTKSH